MTIMPKQWPQVALGEILTERNETPDPALVRAGDIPIISKIRFSDGGIELRTDSNTNTKMILIHPGDLVLSGINAMKGAIAIYQPETSQRAAATIHYAAYEVNKEKADIRYLWWLLRSQYFQEILSLQIPQGIKTELKAKRLLPVFIPLPTITEQQHIIDRIITLYGKISELKRLQEIAAEETTNFIDSYLSTKLSGFDGMEIDEVSLEELLIEKPKNGKSTKLGSENSGIKCLSLASMRNGVIDFLESKPISLSTSEVKGYSINKDDIFICRGNGSRHLVGQAVISDSDQPNIIFPDLMIRIRPDFGRIKKEYLLFYWQSRFMRVQIEEKAKTTAGIWKINQQHLLSLKIYFPKDLSQQEIIVDEINNVRILVYRLIEKQNALCSIINLLRLSLIDKVFHSMT